VGRFFRGFATNETTAEDFDMKGLIAACIAVSIHWVVDIQLNAGRCGDVVKKAVTSVLPR
jgi:hypothetical protein